MIKIPRIDGEYITVYKPAGDIFPGPDEAELRAGKLYNEWVPNDHCFVTDARGRWHAFGITHPLTGFDNVHAGENQSFHAIAPEGILTAALGEGTWNDLPKVLPPAARPCEIRANHAPYIVRHDDLYYMIYGPTPLRYATSLDLLEWTPRGELSNAPEGRDPNILLWNNTYHLLVCEPPYVRMAVSTDLVHWEGHRSILRMEGNLAAESPTLIRHNGTFYLFVCAWDGIWDKNNIQGAYQHITHVYQSDEPCRFDSNQEIARLNAHASEIFQDEASNWYISSAEWPHRGVSIACLGWE